MLYIVFYCCICFTVHNCCKQSLFAHPSPPMLFLPCHSPALLHTTQHSSHFPTLPKFLITPQHSLHSSLLLATPQRSPHSSSLLTTPHNTSPLFATPCHSQYHPRFATSQRNKLVHASSRCNPRSATMDARC